MISNSAESFDSEIFGSSEDDSTEMDHSQDSENGKLSQQSYLSVKYRKRTAFGFGLLTFTNSSGDRKITTRSSSVEKD
jgi:hypothetical protein